MSRVGDDGDVRSEGAQLGSGVLGAEGVHTRPWGQWTFDGGVVGDLWGEGCGIFY